MALLLLHLFHATTVHYKASSCNKGIDLFSFKESMDSSCHETDLDILPFLTKTILRLRTQQVFGMQMSSQHYGNYATEC